MRFQYVVVDMGDWGYRSWLVEVKDIYYSSQIWLEWMYSAKCEKGSLVTSSSFGRIYSRTRYQDSFDIEVRKFVPQWRVFQVDNNRSNLTSNVGRNYIDYFCTCEKTSYWGQNSLKGISSLRRRSHCNVTNDMMFALLGLWLLKQTLLCTAFSTTTARSKVCTDPTEQRVCNR